MKKLKKLAAGAALGAAGWAAAEFLTTKEQRKHIAYNAADKSIGLVLKGLATAIPKASWICEDSDNKDFMSGRSGYSDSAQDGAKWRLGFDRKSILPNDYKTKDYYFGGFLSYPPNVMTDVLDDQAVRAICIDDSSGRGVATFCVIDCIGISNTDIGRIREILFDFARENNIVSINVSATHCHSCIDTLGVWGDILNKSLKNNVKAILKNDKDSLVSGRDKDFMNNLCETCAQVIMNAYFNMTPGELYMAVTDELPYARDKRESLVFDKDIVKLSFKPDNGTRETIAVCMGAHAVALGEKNTVLSGDYPTYIEKQADESGANCIFFQGAQLAIATARGGIVPDGLSGYEPFMEYGRAIARHLLSGKLKEEKLEPFLNIKHKTVTFNCDNYVLILLGKLGLVNNNMTINGKKKIFRTEIGFAQIGGRLSIAMAPGEVAPELIIGGFSTKWNSYSGAGFDLPAVKDMIKGGTKLITFGLCNDSIGYILPDNDFGSIIAPKHYEESVSPGKRSGSTLLRAYSDLIEEFYRQ